MCWYCGSAVTDQEPLGRSQRCIDCGRDLRSCRNCRFFLPDSRSGCAEASGEAPSDKERANFCDWFSLNPRLRSQGSGASAARSAEAKAKSAFDGLFSS